MSTRYLLLVSVIFTILLSACSGGDNAETAATKDSGNSGVVPQYQLDALERAKKTEDLLLQQNEAMNKKLEQQ